MARRRRTIRPKAPPRRVGAVSAGEGATRGGASSLRAMGSLFRFRLSFMTASHYAWRLRTIGVPSGRPGETLQKGGGEGETEWLNASRNRQRPGLQSLPPAAFPARLALATNASHFRAFSRFRGVKIYSPRDVKLSSRLSNAPAS